MTAALERYWRAVATLANGALLDADSPVAESLVLDGLVHAVAVAALHTFQNSSMDRPAKAPGFLAPAGLRRAVAYIEAHADQPISLTDIAAAAHTSPRALQHAFRRHHETTPMSYLRRVRLERAHRELQLADPSRGDTVSAVAARWGFARADRFAAAYRQTFGSTPSATLRA